MSCYELGHQPLALASPLGFLERAGFTPEALDIAVERFDREKVARAWFVGISVSMHTALRLGVGVAEQVRKISTNETERAEERRWDSSGGGSGELSRG
jgi:hypothetical protein